MKHLTEREAELMTMFWDNGPLHVRQLLELFPEPKPHFNTISTFVRILQSKGFVDHERVRNSHRYYATVSREEFNNGTIRDLMGKFYGGSIKTMMSALLADEKLSDEDVAELIEIVRSGKKED